MNGTALEATEVKLQNPGSGSDDDDDENADGSVWVTLFDATASEIGNRHRHVPADAQRLHVRCR